MKLHEIRSVTEEPSSIFEDVRDFVETYVIGENNHTPDWTIPYTGAGGKVAVEFREGITLKDDCKEITIHITSVKGDFIAEGLVTCKNLPYAVTGGFVLRGMQLKHIDAMLPTCRHIDLELTGISSIKEVMENLPPYVRKLYLDNTQIESLEGIADYAKGTITELYFSGEQWKSGGLGVLQLPNLVTFEPGTFVPDVSPMPDWERAQKIIQKYLRKPHAIFDCQSELIEAGLDEYAKL